MTLGGKMTLAFKKKKKKEKMLRFAFRCFLGHTCIATIQT